MAERGRIEINVERRDSSRGALLDLVTPGANEHYPPDAVIEVVVRRQDGMADLGHLADAVARAERAERQVATLNGHVDELDRELKRYRSGHVCVDGCRPNAHVAFVGRHRVAELEAQVARLQQTIAAQDLAGAALKYTAEQVADLQTSEAELVSAPLQARIRELEAERAGLLGRCEALGEHASLAEGRQAAAEQRAARHMRTVEDAEARLTRARDEIGKLKRKVSTLETEVSLLRDHGDAWGKVGARIAEIVTDPAVVMGPQYQHKSDLREAIEQIRTALRSRGRPGTDALGTAERLHASREIRDRIRAEVDTEEVRGALEYETYPPDLERAWYVLAQATRNVRRLAGLNNPGEQRGEQGDQDSDSARQEQREA